MPTTLTLGTLNVHGWHNQHGQDAFSDLLQFFRDARPDILALQEAGRAKAVQLARALEFPHVVCLNNTVVLSKFVCKEAPRPNPATSSSYALPRFARAIVSVPIGPEGKSVSLDVISLHLDHRREEKRVAELRALFESVSESPGHLILMGDFNALTRSDYTNAEWLECTDVRARQSWEAPVSQATAWVRGDSACVSQPASGCSSKKGQRRLPKRRGQVLVDTWDWCNGRKKDADGKEAASTSEEVSKAKSSIDPLLVPTSLRSSCRFGTRIDYIYVSESMVSQGWRIRSSEHRTAIPHLSDHNLVLTTLEYAESGAGAEYEKPRSTASSSDSAKADFDNFQFPGSQSAPLTLCPHDPAWARCFQIESDRLRAALADKVRRIEHVGSTAVPDLVAKPVLDIAVEVRDGIDDTGSVLTADSEFRPSDSLVSALTGLGYINMGCAGVPGRCWFKREVEDEEVASPSRRLSRQLALSTVTQINVYVVPESSGTDSVMDKQVVFRDFLRANEWARRDYGLAKERAGELVSGSGGGADSTEYNEAKATCIQRILEAIQKEEDGIGKA